MRGSPTAELVFDDEINGAGQPVAPTVFVLDPDRLAVFSPEAELDYAIVAVGHRVQGAGALADFGYVPLSDAKDKHRKGMAVNIIQHPRGRKKTIAIRNNFLLDRRDQNNCPLPISYAVPDQRALGRNLMPAQPDLGAPPALPAPRR